MKKLTDNQQSQIINWLLVSQRLYNVIVEIDGIKYRVNRSQGLMTADEGDIKAFPLVTPPTWLIDWVRGQN